MSELDDLSGQVLVVDYDTALATTREPEGATEARRHMAEFARRGGKTVLHSRHTSKRIRRAIDLTECTLAIGEGGYIVVDGDDDEDLVPDGFVGVHRIESPRSPVDVMKAIGLTGYLTSLRVDGFPVLRLSATEHRRVTLHAHGLVNILPVETLQQQIRDRFGPTFTAVRAGYVDQVMLAGGRKTEIDHIHIVPCDPWPNVGSGAETGLGAVAARLNVPPSAIHVIGTTLHMLQSARAAGVGISGLANCESPDVWRKAGVWVAAGSHGFGVAEYLRRRFEIRPSPRNRSTLATQGDPR
jgi:hypothetical protein